MNRNNRGCGVGYTQQDKATANSAASGQLPFPSLHFPLLPLPSPFPPLPQPSPSKRLPNPAGLGSAVSSPSGVWDGASAEI